MTANGESSKTQKPKLLTVDNHDRDRVGLTYVYPVISRRAGGVSVGINLNPNNACNWRCAYCQVPDLSRGAAPPIDLLLLERELRGFLLDLTQGDFLLKHAPPEARVLKDIAISGNGEPTTAVGFDVIVSNIAAVMQDFELVGKIPLVLISNGSLISRPAVLEGLKTLGSVHGELWYKLDSVWPERRKIINDTAQSIEQVAQHLVLAGSRCRVRLQSCMFALDGNIPTDEEIDAYGDFVAACVSNGALIQDILLYGLARPSLQPDAKRLSRIAEDEMQRIGNRIQARAQLPVHVHP